MQEKMHTAFVGEVKAISGYVLIKAISGLPDSYPMVLLLDEFDSVIGIQTILPLEIVAPSAPTKDSIASKYDGLGIKEDFPPYEMLKHLLRAR